MYRYWGKAPIIGKIMGVTKAYCTRVEVDHFLQSYMMIPENGCAKPVQSLALTTGRPRRCGWIDLIAIALFDHDQWCRFTHHDQDRRDERF